MAELLGADVGAPPHAIDEPDHVVLAVLDDLTDRIDDKSGRKSG
jgi:hypothetical protein